WKYRSRECSPGTRYKRMPQLPAARARREASDTGRTGRRTARRENAARDTANSAQEMKVRRPLREEAWRTAEPVDLRDRAGRSRAPAAPATYVDSTKEGVRRGGSWRKTEAGGFAAGQDRSDRTIRIATERTGAANRLRQSA